MTEADARSYLLERLDLREYEATALEELLALGRSTAPNLVEATGIPQARIYDVLASLGDKGYIKIIPGRPKEYQAKPPEEVLDRAVENRRQSFESYRQQVDEFREEFLETFEPIFQTASGDITPAEELFYVVDVGEPSEVETRALYHDAEMEIRVLTKSFEYFSDVEPAIREALDRGLSMRVLFVHPRHLTDANRDIQQEILERLSSEYSEIGYRFSDEPLPLRGTIVDPSMDYESGTAIFLVEEKDVPLYMRQAAITENGSFVAGMSRFFELIWQYESRDSPVIGE